MPKFMRRLTVNEAKVYDCTALSKRKIYRINSTFYRYRYCDDSPGIGHEHYIFEPLAGQQAWAKLTLTKNKVRAKVFELSGALPPTKNTAAFEKAIQLPLF